MEEGLAKVEEFPKHGCLYSREHAWKPAMANLTRQESNFEEELKYDSLVLLMALCAVKLIFALSLDFAHNDNAELQQWSKWLFIHD